jgi:hypothetical protein
MAFEVRFFYTVTLIVLMAVIFFVFDVCHWQLNESI